MAITLTQAPSLWARALSSLPEKDQKIFQISNTPPPDTGTLLQDILSALEKQRDRCKRDVWTAISEDGKELVIRDVCAKIATYVKKFLAVVDVAVQYDPVHAALPWAGVRFLLQLSFSAFETFGAIVEGLEKATGLIARCGILEALVFQKGGTSDAKIFLEKEMVKMYSRILGFLCKAKKYHDGSRLKRALNLISKQSLQESVHEMEAAEQNVLVLKGLVDSDSMGEIQNGISTMLLTVNSVADDIDNIQTRLKTALLDLEKPLLRMTDQVSEIHDTLKENERMHMLQWLSTVPVQQHFRESCTALLPGSGEWLLKSLCFMNWKDSSSSEMFWLHGIPGCGKTKLAAIVIQSFNIQSDGTSQSAPIAHFFCSRNPAEPERSDSGEILRSLVKQVSLFGKATSLRRPFVEVYQKRQEEANRVGESPAPLAVEENIDLICELGRTTPLTIVIDALDECDSQQRRILLNALEEIRRRCRDVVKIFVSSRYANDIAVFFRKGQALEVTPAINEDDLKRFVKNQVGEFVRRWSIIHDETTSALQQLEKDITKVLIAGAQGMFLWVALQIESIGDTDRIKDIDGVRQALKSVPSTIRLSYEAIHRRIQSMSDSPRQVAVRCLQWLLYAERKLSISELVAAVSRLSSASSVVSPKSIVDYCCNLVIIDNEADTFRLAHLTVREFLENSSYYSIENANEMIAETCLNIYLSNEWEDDVLLSYATRYWPVHVEHLHGSPQRVAIKTTLTKFLNEEEHFEDWLECLAQRPTEEGFIRNHSLERRLEASFSTPPSALFIACCFGILEALECSDSIGTLGVNLKNAHNTSGLYLAARWGHGDVARKLIDLGADVNASGGQYGDALQAASFAGHEEIVKVLLENGASLSPTDKGEYSSSLQAALANGHNTVAQILIDAGFKSMTQKIFDDVLETASFNGDVEVVERLLSDQAATFKPNIRPDPLQVALYGGKVRQAQRLLKNCDDINEEKGYFGNAVAAAIASRKLDVLKIVVDAGANLHSRGRFGFPLRAAAIVNQVDMTKYLLEKGLDPNIEDKELGDPLQAAASLGNVDIILLLLTHNASVDGSGGHFGNTLQAASFNGYEHAVRLLIEHGAALQNKRGYGFGRYRDALQAAVYAGQEEIVELLLTAGAELYPGRIIKLCPCSMVDRPKRNALPISRAGTGNFDIASELGPLEVAARRGNLTLVKLFLAKGAPIDAKDADSEDEEYDSGCAYTALQIAAFWGHIPVVECLLDHGADINAVRQTLGTPLQAGLEGGHFDVSEFLLSRGAEIDKHWNMYGSCLQVFSERGHLETVRFLLNQGANIEDRGGYNGNALQVACDAGNIDIVQFLLEKGANVRASGKNIGNALQAASAKGHIDIVKLLLHHGVDIDDTDNKTETALGLAASNGHEDLVIFLLQQGANVDGSPNLAIDDALEDSNSHDNPSLDARASPDEKVFIQTPLHLAAFNAHESIVSILLENGANVYFENKLHPMKGNGVHDFEFNKCYGTPLFTACFWGHASIAKRLFQHGPCGYLQDAFTSSLSISLTRDKQEITTMLVGEGIRAGFNAGSFDDAFKLACKKGHSSFVERILKHFPPKSWPKSLLLAVKNGSSSVVDILLRNGADVGIHDKKGNDLLEVTIGKIKRHRNTYWTSNSPDWTEVLRILVDAGATRDLCARITEISPDIAKGGTIDLFEALERHGCNLLQDPLHYYKALMSASQHCDIEMVHYLGTKYTPTEKYIKEAILEAMHERENYSMPTIKELLSFNIPLSFDSDDEYQPLPKASGEGYSEIVDLLLQHTKCNADTIEYALKRAIQRNHVSCARLILDSQNLGTEARSVLCTRLSPRCFPFSSEKMVDYILGQGVSPNTRDSENGETLLYIAAKKNDYKGVMRLVSWGADVDLAGGEHGTALHAAAVSGRGMAIESLLSCGANVNAVSEPIGTPLMAIMAQKWSRTCLASVGMGNICQWECHQCCAKILLEWDADILCKGRQV